LKAGLSGQEFQLTAGIRFKNSGHHSQFSFIVQHKIVIIAAWHLVYSFAYSYWLPEVKRSTGYGFYFSGRNKGLIHRCKGRGHNLKLVVENITPGPG